MKPYFAHYLPVEEEIKPRDKVYWTDPEGITSQLNTAIEVHEDIIFMSEPDGSEIEAFPHEVKKVKLFLCSRDIQVGDEAYIAKRNFQAPTYLVTEVDFDGSDFLKGAFKVIGEISPDALSYVKEGDVFIEEYWRPVDNSHIPGLVLNKKTFKSSGYDEYLIQIKGPCGHFH